MEPAPLKQIKSYLWLSLIDHSMTFKRWLFLFLSFTPFFVWAQRTNIINSNRPGSTESAYAVGTGIFQVENGFTLEGNTEKENQNHFKNLLFLRYGWLFEELELNLSFDLNQSRIKDTAPQKFNGFRLGAKYLIYNHEMVDKSKEVLSWKKRNAYNWSQLIPSVAIKIQYSNFLEKTTEDRMNLVLLLQNQLLPNWNAITNFYLMGNEFKNLEHAFLISTTYALNNRWALFGESKNKVDFLEKKWVGSVGFAFLVHKNLQLDLSLNTGSLHNDARSGISGGISWRLDRSIEFEDTKDQF